MANPWTGTRITAPFKKGDRVINTYLGITGTLIEFDQIASIGPHGGLSSDEWFPGCKNVTVRYDGREYHPRTIGTSSPMTDIRKIED